MSGFEVVADGPLTRPLSGTVHVGGAKNSALKLMAASLLAPGRTVVHAVPHILDVVAMGELLTRLGCSVELSFPDQVDAASGSSAGQVVIEVPEELGHEAPYDLVRRLRASIAVLGPLTARCLRASVALPGGDAIGSRGLDMHMRGLEQLGATVRIEHGQVVTRAERLTGAELTLDFPSVGATENLLMAAVLAEGRSVIDNVAREPEIVDLCQMLLAMGARIEGVGSATLEVEGVDRLHPVEHRTVTDRIVTGTWVFAAAIAGGELHVAGGCAQHLDLVLDKLVTAGLEVDLSPEDGFTVRCERRLRAFDVSTLPYPGFPTDLQPFAMALAAVSDGTAMITENVFEARFMFAQELARLGADLRTDGHHAVVRGVPVLSGAPVVAHDIRAGAALVLAGLAAQGRTVVAEGHHVDRGYPWFAEALAAVGAQVTRTDRA